MSENDICNVLIENASNLGFRSFGEYEGWDFVLVRGNLTVGVQAKAQLNLHLVAQAVILNNVDFKVILYGQNIENKEAAKDWKAVCRSLGLIRISLEDNIPYFVDIGSPASPFYSDRYYYNRVSMFMRYRHFPKKKIKIPEFDYSNPAGVPSPRTVTQYNISLVKLDMFADSNGGTITVQDARRLGIDRIPRRYYYYDFKNRKWFKDKLNNASLDYKHIYNGLVGGKNK